MEIREQSYGCEEITLSLMQPQKGALCPEDDWTGITSTAERRKRQNKLNQRSARKRKSAVTRFQTPLLIHAAEAASVVARARGFTQGDRNGTLITPELMRLINRFTNQQYLQLLSSQPSIEHLPTVIHLNVLNALAMNATALGLSALWLFCEATSPFGYVGPSPANASGNQWPQQLRPTDLQLASAHHPWVDLLPHPRLRDNILRGCYEGADFDEDDLWFDLVDMATTGPGSKSPSLLMWGSSPWDIGGWEASEAFLQKWGFLLVGCPEIIQATNYWRFKRGEKRVEMDVIEDVI